MQPKNPFPRAGLKLGPVCFLIYVSFFDASLVNAFLIGTLNKNELIEQSCMIFSYSPTKGHGFCSGTIISKKHFLSAAHCVFFSDVVRAKIKCPNEKVKWVTRKQYPKSYSIPSELFHDATTLDIALFEIEDEFSTPPARLPSSPEEIEKLIRDSKNCTVYGYGLDAESIVGRHNGSKITFGEFEVPEIRFQVGGISLIPLVPIAINVTRRRIHSGVFIVDGKVIQPGDSGGGIFCENDKSEKILVGMSNCIPADLAVHKGYAITLTRTLSLLNNTMKGREENAIITKKFPPSPEALAKYIREIVRSLSIIDIPIHDVH